MPSRKSALHPLAALLGLPLVAPALRAAEDVTLPPVQIIGTTPVPGIGLPKDQIPANLQTLDAATLQASGDPSLAATLQRRLPSVNLNETQGNPWQPDLNYRGFTVSPLLGTPQGLSVFLDGVRMNEGFGDVVNWDIIPRAAIADMSLVPGSNPLYGLNTLGGAIALQTKRGDSHPGGEAEASYGSFGRKSLSALHGGQAGNVHWFASAEGMKEDGWRDHSPSEVGQLFTKLGWADARTDLALSVAYAHTDLIGNALLPESMLRRDRESVFTHPDNTNNRATLVAFNGSHWISDDDQLAAVAYLRRTRTRTLNGDLNDDYADEFALDPGFDQTGVMNRTATDQNAAGLALQWSATRGAHQFALGAAYDHSHARFTQTAQDGVVTADREVVGNAEEELDNRLVGRTRSTSLYFTDTVALASTVHLTAAARYNHTRVTNEDRLDPTPPNLDGDFTYRKFNPAVGLTWEAAPALTVYASFNQGNRAPTPIELGCADPANPCTLPNALAADPFLKQVVARSLEVGVRGRLPEGMAWNASLFRTTNRDDILFVGTSTSAGYFTNFGKTRREGVELGLSGATAGVDWQVNYSYLKATFQSSACLLAENNSSAGSSPACGADEIRVTAGDRLPGLPEHALKLLLTWRPSDKLRLGADLAAYSDQTVRGNENGRQQADDNHRGSGTLGGYGVVNLDADYQLGGGWTAFGRVANLFDHRYASAGALAENPFDAAGQFQADPDAWRGEQFVAPGAPRAAWVGVRYRWGAK
jgi:iron complex outermembrane recepter protein